MMISPEMQSARIEVRGLTKRFHHQPVLDDLSLIVEDGDICVLVGANGVGKTTLLRIIASLTRADAGEVILGSMNTPINARHAIGYAGHQSMSYLDLSAAENLHHYARLYQIPDEDKTVNLSIQSVGLEGYRDRPVRTFSRGMQQRLSLARALLHNPAVLLLDEPYTGLDRDAAHFLNEKLHSLRQPGRVTLLAAHRPQNLLSIASHIAWLKDGKIVQHLLVERLSESPELVNYLQEGA
jgi:heme exporter protein A